MEDPYGIDQLKSNMLMNKLLNKAQEASMQRQMNQAYGGLASLGQAIMPMPYPGYGGPVGYDPGAVLISNKVPMPDPSVKACGIRKPNRKLLLL